ncbi:MAG: type I methionyl aminopeptidase [Clostridiales bacterium]|jgi:methionyl aminopeptidase|nr:type I methionyl aminopeptidase [Clostridiales bacterium]MDR2752223.1 type I methionyl aminopeptidase [Clostridiales bacterium]
MPIRIKSEEQIRLMRAANKVVADTHKLLESLVKPGITTGELDAIAEDNIRKAGAYPSFLGYGNPPFPASTCISVNEEVIHGIPGLRTLKEGDIVSIDIGACLNGYHGDSARTHPVGAVSQEKKRLIDVTRNCFFAALEHVKAGHHLNEIGAAIEDLATAAGFSVVRDFVGHGVGRDLHEEPQIVHYRVPSRGPKLVPGMTLAVEPMINAGTWGIKVLQDNWTVVTRDGKCSAHYENTILVTDGAPEILTMY